MMGKVIDLTGQKFGRLTAIERIPRKKESGKHALWKCRCECGNFTFVTSDHLRNGNVKSCGKHNHNKSNSRLFSIWLHMRNRCSNQKDKNFYNYGGRGIAVCDEWQNDFLAFYDWAMANGYKDNLTIERIDNNGNYEPANCRWATKKEQANNTRKNHLFTYGGKTQTISQWAEEYGIKPNTLLYRIRRVWNFERAITEKINTKCR